MLYAVVLAEVKAGDENKRENHAGRDPFGDPSWITFRSLRHGVFF